MASIGGAPVVSYLRAYEPLDAFDDDDQLSILGQRSRKRSETEELDRQASMTRVLRSLSDPYPRKAADLFRVLLYPSADGIPTPYYCPNQLMVRSTLAAETLAETISGPLLEMLLPESAREAHRERLDADELVDSLAKLHTRSAIWGIPFGWFVLFHEDDQTELVEEDGRITTVRLAAPVHQCVERARSAVASLAIAAPELDLLEELTDLIEWLSAFQTGAILELDYGWVADLVYPDDSPMDVRHGIEALADGDMTGAAASYRRMAQRWIPVRQLARGS
ncbi:hypothetical protein [Arthrobacter roseus]|uniref:hypothetical protein n=1 Tax=Arthrobacter roseus TaxID=136274 RepID=UPI00308426B4|nr:hypothetical protein [Arthrobacter roseus]